MASIEINSINQMLGRMIRKVIADTAGNDINAGSMLLTLLEACASNDFENNAAILHILDLMNVDSIRNNDLDSYAANLGVTRLQAKPATGSIVISDSTITKRSTSLYPIKPAPISGATEIYVSDASDFSNTGSIYIGRGTINFEGPISYTSIVNNGTFYTIMLSSALQKDHLISDTVIDGQGSTDRLISAGTSVYIEANNQSPKVEYLTIRDGIIPAGEDTSDSIDIVARISGSIGNASLNTIVNFSSIPFTGALVSNPKTLTNGRDTELDENFRIRIKSYSQTLARGTKPSILASIIGISDQTENKRVTSAIITEPVAIGDPSILYIDDGNGFQPSYAGQSVDNLISYATGKEEFIQLANYPLPRAQIVNTVNGPFEINDGMFLRVKVDDAEETVYFSSAQFTNITSATLVEIVSAINDQSTIFKSRADNNSTRLLLYTEASDAETIQVMPASTTDDITLIANDVLKFPTDVRSYIKLYKNGELLKEKEKAANLTTTAFSTWNITTDSDIALSVDNTPAQSHVFTSLDFNGVAYSLLTIQDWMEAFNKSFAGVKAEIVSGTNLIIKSNSSGSNSSIQILGGSLLNKWFANLDTESNGQTSDFEINRQNGNIRIKSTINSGDEIVAGTSDAKGFIISSETISGQYNLAQDTSGRDAIIILVADAINVTNRAVSLLSGTSFTIQSMPNNIMKITSSSIATFSNVYATGKDFIYIAYRDSDANWFSEVNTGLFKVISKGDHTSAGTDTYIEVLNPLAINEAKTLQSDQDIKCFYSDTYPQLWNGSLLANASVASLDEIQSSLNESLINIKASIYKTNAIKLTSTTEDNGSICVPIVNGAASILFDQVYTPQVGNKSHRAYINPINTLYPYFKHYNIQNTTVWLNRYAGTDIKGLLSANATPGIKGTDSFSEVISSTGILNTTNISHDDIINFTAGNNKGLIRNISQILTGDSIGTSYTYPSTLMNFIENQDEFNILESLKFSDSDSVVLILDNDSVSKTVDIPMSRTGIVNSGSQMSVFTPTKYAFSANDKDNEVGVDFGTLQVWDKVTNNTEFAEYKIWFKARNWYTSGGASSGGPALMVRSSEYGPCGEQIRFSIEYPHYPNSSNQVTLENTPDYILCKYFFGSGAAKTVNFSNISPLNQVSIADQGNNIYRYTFDVSVDFSSVVPGDVLSILDNSGFSIYNRGQLLIVNKVNNFTLDLYNPNGSDTTAAQPEISSVTTIADVVGTNCVHTVTTVGAGALNGTYFILPDINGTVAFWYDVNNAGTPEPTHGASRSIKISTVLNTDNANAVASKTTSYIDNDNQYSATVLNNVITVTNSARKLLAAGNAGTSGFTVVRTVAGSDDASLTGKYFTLYDQNGSVAVWFDVDNVGTPEPIHNADRSIKVSTIVSGDSSNTVAGKVRAVINLDAQFTCSVPVANVFLITDNFNGPRSNIAAGTSGFTVSVSQNGSNGLPETISIIQSINIYSLLNTLTSDIKTAVNAKGLLNISEVTSGNIIVATKDEISLNPSTVNSLAYGHDSNPTNGLNEYISLYDSESWIMDFNNTNPNFILKTPMLLQGVFPAIYSMNTAINDGISDVGELFKLMPTTLQNAKHHLTHKALSQLPIIAELDIDSRVTKIQIKSKQLGSSGSIELVGGRGNSSEFEIVGDSEVATINSSDYLMANIAAYPNTLNTGDLVKIKSNIGTNRKYILSSDDSMDVDFINSDSGQYSFNKKVTNFVSTTRFTVTDANTYDPVKYPTTGIAWKWVFDKSGACIVTDKTLGTPSNAVSNEVSAGGSSTTNLKNIILEAGSASAYQKFYLTFDGTPTQGDYYTFRSANGTTFAVWLDVDGNNTPPAGATYTAATNKIKVSVLSTDTKDILTTKLQATLTLNANFIANFSSSAIIASIDKVKEGDILNAYGTLSGWPAGNKVGSIGENKFPGFPIVEIDVANRFFIIANPSGSAMTLQAVGTDNVEIMPSPIVEWRVPHTVSTRYKIESLNINNLFRLKYVDGTNPYFMACGVAIDDIIYLSGNTFTSNNNGYYRVRAVDNSSIIFENSNGTEILNTDNRPFNNSSTKVTWIKNYNKVTGAVGAFANLSIGNHVRKVGDEESLWRQVIAFDTGLAATATEITLSGNYLGNSDFAYSIYYDQINDVNKGVFIQDINDIRFFEGDAVTVGDKWHISNIVDTNWFNIRNTGTFDIAKIGTDSSYRPFIRVYNANALSQVNRLMSVDIDRTGVSIIEGSNNRYDTIRKVHHIAINANNQEQRLVYMIPSDRSYKINQSNASIMSPICKLNYPIDIHTGIDGYQYYTGLLRTVQRIVDGFEADPTSYPGRRAVGSIIETLPPLIKKITMSISITTNEGVNLGDISSEIKSTIINYVNNLGVGENVILSEIIARIMRVRGVKSCAFTTPSPSNEFISVPSTGKAYIESSGILVA